MSEYICIKDYNNGYIISSRLISICIGERVRIEIDYPVKFDSQYILGIVVILGI